MGGSYGRSVASGKEKPWSDVRYRTPGLWADSYFSPFTHESFKVTVRLNTGALGFVSTRSATK